MASNHYTHMLSVAYITFESLVKLLKTYSKYEAIRREAVDAWMKSATSRDWLVACDLYLCRSMYDVFFDATILVSLGFRKASNSVTHTRTHTFSFELNSMMNQLNIRRENRNSKRESQRIFNETKQPPNDGFAMLRNLWMNLYMVALSNTHTHSHVK